MTTLPQYRPRNQAEQIRQGAQVNYNTEDCTLHIYRIVLPGHARRVLSNLSDMSEHEQCCGRRHLSYSMVGADICYPRRTQWSLPLASGHQQYCGRQQTVLYPMVWATRLGNTHSLSPKLVWSSPSSVKGDTLSPKRTMVFLTLSLLSFRHSKHLNNSMALEL